MTFRNFFLFFRVAVKSYMSYFLLNIDIILCSIILNTVDHCLNFNGKTFFSHQKRGKKLCTRLKTQMCDTLYIMSVDKS